MKVKFCPQCKKNKNFMQFRNDKTRKDGLSCWCRNCLSEQSKEYTKRPEVITRRQKWEKVNRKRRRKQQKKNYYKNIEKEHERSRIYREKNIEKNRETLKRHYKNNKDQYLKRNAERNRKLKWIKVMDNPFPRYIEIDCHHLNDLLVIPIPRILHKFCYNNIQNKHRKLCNEKIELLGLWSNPA